MKAITRERFDKIVAEARDTSFDAWRYADLLTYCQEHERRHTTDELWQFAERFAKRGRTALLVRLADVARHESERVKELVDRRATVRSLDRQLREERARIKAMAAEVLQAREVNARTEALERKVRKLTDMLVLEREHVRELAARLHYGDDGDITAEIERELREP